MKLWRMFFLTFLMPLIHLDTLALNQITNGSQSCTSSLSELNKLHYPFLTNTEDASQSYSAWDLGWSPDSNRLAVTYNRYDGRRDEIYIWDLQGNDNRLLLERVFTEFVLTPATKAWSPNGRYLAISSEVEVSLWDFEQEKIVVLDDVNLRQPGLVWSPDSEQVATIGEAVIVWDASSGQKVNEIDVQGRFHTRQVIWSPENDLQWLTTESIGGAANNGFSIWQENNPTPVFTLEGQYSGGWLSPSGKLLAVLNEGQLEIWDIEENNLIRKLDIRGNELTWSPDERCLAIVAGVNMPTEAGGQVTLPHLQVWSIFEGKLLQTLDENARDFRSLRWSPNGKFFAYIDANNVIRVFELTSAG